MGPPRRPAAPAGRGRARPCAHPRPAAPAGNGGGVPGGQLGRSEDGKHSIEWYGPRSHAPWTRPRPTGTGPNVRLYCPLGWLEVTTLGVARPGRLRAATRLLGLALLLPACGADFLWVDT